jgi:hypothetical protein
MENSFIKFTSFNIEIIESKLVPLDKDLVEAA